MEESTFGLMHTGYTHEQVLKSKANNEAEQGPRARLVSRRYVMSINANMHASS